MAMWCVVLEYLPESTPGCPTFVDDTEWHPLLDGEAYFALLDERARKLGLNISDAEIVKRITTNPAFLSPTGQFDRPRFEAILRQNGYSEARFIAEERRQMLRRQLGASVVLGPNVPNMLIEAVNRYQNEQRSIEYVLLDRAHAGEIAEPTPDPFGPRNCGHSPSARTAGSSERNTTIHKTQESFIGRRLLYRQISLRLC